jgi:hypothetical protein
MRLIVSDGQARRELLLENILTVGRDPDCEISHADPRLSRRHAEFVPTPEGVVVRDLASRNGVKVNGKSAHEALLHAGDLVEVGVLALQLVDDDILPTIGKAASIATPIVAPGPIVEVAAAVEDDRTRIVPQRLTGHRPQIARLAPTVTDIGDVVLQDANSAPPPAVPSAADAGSTLIVRPRVTGRVIAECVVLAVLVFAVTAGPLVVWQWRAVGSVSIETEVSLAAAFFAAVAAAVLIGRRIARAVRRVGA